MASDPCSGERINLFSLVTYLPEPLGGFIDQLRGELVPGCDLRAHVTLLPPRPLVQTPEAARAHVRATLKGSTPFDVKLGDVEIFATSSVVYVALAEGFELLRSLHEVLNAGAAYFKEPFPYHPHITLAQQISEAQVPAVFDMARHRWAAFKHARSFPIDRATFVQATLLNSWIDLQEDKLGQE